jgi:excisionase family DNA binding protein
MMQAGANVQVVVSVADLKELFNQWQDERDAMRPAPKEDRLLTADEACILLNVSSVTLWRWAKMGYLKPVKAGRKVHYWLSAIDNLLKQKEG